MKTSTGAAIAKGAASGGITAISGTATFMTALVVLGASFDHPKMGLVLVYAGIHGLPILFLAGFVPYLGKAIKSAVMNGRLKRDLRKKIIDKEVVIKAGHSYEGLLCVASSEYSPQFNLILQSMDSARQPLIFPIELRQSF
jgi:hypothetical protein